MRLTLRTLLAYLDDILDPADHEDLGQKIEASDFATELIHRSRDVSRRLRLSAPPVDAGAEQSGGAEGGGGGVRVADANVVAEYLDNTLPPEDLADFERLCIEPSTKADMHLAEVVSCHHVLTMVLGEPAEIDPQLKERLYQLPADLASGKKLRIESAHVPPAQVAPDAPPAASAPPAHATPAGRQTATPGGGQLPDYLLAAAASRTRVRRILLAMVAVAGVGLLAWLVAPLLSEPDMPSDLAAVDMEEFTGEILIEDGPIEMLGDLGSGADNTVSAPAEPAAETAAAVAVLQAPLAPYPPAAESGSAEPPASTVAEDPLPAWQADLAHPADATETADPAAAVEAADSPDGGLPGTGSAIPPGPSSPSELDGAEMKASVTGTTAAGTTAAGSSPLTESLSNNQWDVPGDATADEPMTAIPAETGPAEVAETAPVQTGSAEMGSAEMGSAEMELVESEPAETGSVEMGASGGADERSQPALVPQEPIQIGKYLGNRDVLLRYDQPSQEWRRLSPRSPLSTGEVLLSLPKFRTHVVVGDINLYLSGGTQLRLVAPADRQGDTAALELALDFGRALVIAGLQGNRLALQLGDQLRQFQLDSSASLAVEVRRVFVPGSDLRQQSPVEIVWYLTSGTVVWPNAAGQQQTIAGPAMWKTLAGVDDLPLVIDELPAWIDGESVTESERRARNALDKELPFDRSVALRLLELSGQNGLGRRREVRTLTAEATVYVGVFEPSVQALGDSDLSRTWEVQIDALRQAMARSPQVAEQVQAAFVNQRGAAAAADLMEMLVGYDLGAVGDTRPTGVLAKLIRWLEHDSLDYRVLAIHNLNEITGVYDPDLKRRTANLGGFKPNGPIKKRQIAVKKLWQRLEADDLQPRK